METNKNWQSIFMTEKILIIFRLLKSSLLWFNDSIVLNKKQIQARLQS